MSTPHYTTHRQKAPLSSSGLVDNILACLLNITRPTASFLLLQHTSTNKHVLSYVIALLSKSNLLYQHKI